MSVTHRSTSDQPQPLPRLNKVWPCQTHDPFPSARATRRFATPEDKHGQETSRPAIGWRPIGASLRPRGQELDTVAPSPIAPDEFGRGSEGPRTPQRALQQGKLGQDWGG